METLKTETISEKNLAIAARQGAETAETNAAESEVNAAASAVQAETLANSISLGGIFWPETEALRLRVLADEGTFIKPMRLIDPEMDNVQGVNTPLLTNMAAYKTGKLYSIRPADASGDFTCVRATTATRINQLGESEVVPANTPVIDWATGSPLLIVSVVGELTLTTPANATKVIITVNGAATEYSNIFPTLTLPIGSISSVIATDGGIEYDLLRDYLLRVHTASGTINEQGARDLKAMYEFLDDKGLLANTELLYLANAGMVQRTDGLLKFVRTAFDASDEDNDLNGSATATIQPRLVGGIAPGSKVAASNQNGEARYFKHPAISFGATDTWSASIVLNWNGNNETFVALVGNNYTGAGRSHIAIRRADTNRWAFFNDSQIGDFIGIDNTSKYIGKNIVVSFIASGSNNIKVYVGGVEKGSLTIATHMDFSSVFSLLSDLTTQAKIKGSISTYLIQSTALTPTQVAGLHTILRGLYPEIESVDIGTETWATRNFEATTTPMGNVIPEVQTNGAVEKVVNNASFDTDTVWNKGGGWTISDGKANKATGATSNISQVITGIGGKWIKVTYTVSNRTAGIIAASPDAVTFAKSTNNNNLTYSDIIKPPGNNLYIRASFDFNGSIDDVSVQELNWSNATEIYDAVYAATSGTTAQKEYAALKEAAMWRYPNNSIDKGSWAGKIYNKYAMKLLALDMASANFGYHIPTNAEVAELLAQVGNDTNKLKYVGLDYWNDAIGTNESGLTLLGTGVITPEGVYTGEKELTGFWTSDSNELPTSGLPIRIIKDYV